MENRPAYKFLTNVPTKITLLFDKPLEKEGQYGKYWIYKSTINGAEESFFANIDLHGILMNRKRGDVVEIKAVEDYANGKRTVHYVSNEVGTSTRIINQKVSNEVEKTEQDKWDNIAFGKCKTLFLLEAFKFNKVAGGDGDALTQWEPVAERWSNACMRRLETKTDVQKIEEYFNTPNIPTINVDEEPPMLSEPPF